MATTNGIFGTPLQGTLLSNATDTIKLNAGSAGVVSINFVHPDGPGTAGASFTLQLVDSLGNVLIERTAGGNLAMVTTVAGAGDYYLKVIDPTSNGSGPGAYTITADLSAKAGTTYDGAINNNTVNAIATALDTPIVGSLNSRDVDVFKIKAAAGGVVTLDFVHPNGPGKEGVQIAIELVDAAGNVVVKTTTSGNTVLTSTVAAAGDYFIRVLDGNEYQSGDGGLYTLTPSIASTASTTYDGAANNTNATAIATVMGRAIVGSVNANDVDVFKLRADAGGELTLDFVHPAGAGTGGAQVGIELYDAAGNLVIKTTVGGNTVLNTTIAGAGDYYVKVMDGNEYQSGDGGIYTLTPKLVTAAGTTYDGAANNANASAIVGAFGTPIVGSLNSKDSDVFKLHADAGGVVTLDFTHPNGPGKDGVQIAIELVDGAGNLVIQNTTSGNTVLKTTVAAAGDYYVKIMDGNEYQSGDGGIYKLVPSIATAPATTYDGAANNANASAIASAFGTPIVGSLNSKDSDVFKLRADAGGVVTLDFTHPNGPGKEGAQIAIELYDGAGNLVIKNTTSGNTVLKTTVAAAGDYYVKVMDGNEYQSGDGGIYKLVPSIATAANTVYDGAANNTSAAALKAAAGMAIVGSINDSDTDYFSFSAASSGTLSLNVTHPGGAGSSGSAISVTVLDANGATVFSKNLSGSELLSANLPSAGDYLLKVADGNVYNNTDGGLYTIMAGVASNGGSTQTGTAASEQLTGTAGNDVINGAGGIDIVSYGGNAADYRIAISAAGVSVVDTTGKAGSDLLFNVERLQFADRTVSLEVNGVAAQAYRVYQAAFDRTPDAGGLGYWIANMEKGSSLTAVAKAFIDSQEFRDVYGVQPSHRDMVAKFYTNVLHRAPDEAGLEFWVKALDSGAIDAATALTGFSESAENVAQLTGIISQGIGYLPFG
jgi:hypothetical protein